MRYGLPQGNEFWLNDAATIDGRAVSLDGMNGGLACRFRRSHGRP